MLRNVCLLFVFTAFLASCSKKSKCENALNNGGTMEINSESLDLITAQLVKTNLVENDVIVVQVAGIDSDCVVAKNISFSLTQEAGKAFEGTYDIKKYIDAEVGDITSVMYTVSNATQGTSTSVSIDSGTVKVTKKGDSEYKFVISGTTVEKKSFEATIESKF